MALSRNATRLEKLAATFHARPRPPTTEEKARDRISFMTSGERRKLMARLHLAASLGREPSLHEVERLITSGDLARINADPRTFEMLAGKAERRGSIDAARRFREIAAQKRKKLAGCGDVPCKH